MSNVYLPGLDPDLQHAWRNYALIRDDAVRAAVTGRYRGYLRSGWTPRHALEQAIADVRGFGGLRRTSDGGIAGLDYKTSPIQHSDLRPLSDDEVRGAFEEMSHVRGLPQDGNPTLLSIYTRGAQTRVQFTVWGEGVDASANVVHELGIFEDKPEEAALIARHATKQAKMSAGGKLFTGLMVFFGLMNFRSATKARKTEKSSEN